MSDSKMMSWFQTATRNIKIPEKFIDIQKSLRNGKFHGWTDVFDRDYDGSIDFEEDFRQENLDKNSSGYLKDGFVVEDDNSVLSDITEEENDDDDSDYLGSDEDDDQNESDHNETDDEDSEYLESDEDEESEYLPSDEEVEVLSKNLDEEFDENEDSEYEPSETDESENSSFNDDNLNIIKKINYYKNKIKGLEKLIQ